jgi:hypothetical protein
MLMHPNPIGETSREPSLRFSLMVAAGLLLPLLVLGFVAAQAEETLDKPTPARTDLARKFRRFMPEPFWVFKPVVFLSFFIPKLNYDSIKVRVFPLNLLTNQFLLLKNSIIDRLRGEQIYLMINRKKYEKQTMYYKIQTFLNSKGKKVLQAIFPLTSSRHCTHIPTQGSSKIKELAELLPRILGISLNIYKKTG